MASSLITSWQTEGKKVETVTVFIFFFWSPKSLWMVTIAIKLKDSIPPWKESFNKPGRHIKQQRHHFAGKGLYSQSCDFSSSCVWMWEWDHKEGWAPKNWYFWTMVLEKTLESPWTTKRSNQSILKEINLEYSLEGLLLKLKLLYFGHLMWRTDSLE